MHTNDDTASRTATIARLNDNARLGLDRRARVQFTSNCLETFRPTPETHVAFVQAELLKAFRHCEFAADSPEHDFASILHRERKVWMKIDYYDLACDYGSEDPANAEITTRVITILLPEDY
ncbi:MAG: hypothetical protein CVT74_15955 [Alphaproteobacteria bacterium HGW-Alphaproteobacteria-13]|nr:MAG: hypothetical protein CVT74_15955 [Alphaproteobacteria bacterium HGW-Alphaproteobacteria-13]